MDDRAETLRRRIEFYRRRLREGVEAEVSKIYLFEIADAQLELAELLARSEEQPKPSG